MNGNNNIKKKGRYNFLIAKSVYLEFSQVCENAGIVRYKNLENYMKEFVKKHKSKE